MFQLVIFVPVIPPAGDAPNTGSVSVYEVKKLGVQFSQAELATLYFSNCASCRVAIVTSV